jgi:SAM-dependent methyltransferase
MHTAAYAYVEHMLARHPYAPDAYVVEIGGRDVNGSVRALFHTPAVRYLSTDVSDGIGVDQVADGATLTLDTPADVVVCCEVLEHAANAGDIVANMARIATPGGLLLITAAGAHDTWARAPHSAIDGGDIREGEHYANITPHALSAWLTQAGCVDVQIWLNAAACDIYASARVAH